MEDRKPLDENVLDWFRKAPPFNFDYVSKRPYFRHIGPPTAPDLRIDPKLAVEFRKILERLAKTNPIIDMFLKGLKKRDSTTKF